MIGERVFIGTGPRIIGPIYIAEEVVIGANGIDEQGITVAGNPAKKLVTEVLYTTIYQPMFRISSLRYNASTMAIVLSVLLEGAMFGIWYLSTSSNMLISQCVALCAIAFFAKSLSKILYIFRSYEV